MNSIRQKQNNYRGNNNNNYDQYRKSVDKNYNNRNYDKTTNNGEFIKKFRNLDMGPPINILPLGYISYSCEQEIICKATMENNVPYFNTPIYLKNKQQIGKVNEIFGNIKDYYVSITLSSDIMKAESFKKNEELFIDATKVLSIDRFLPKANVIKNRNQTSIKCELDKKKKLINTTRFNDNRGRPGIIRNYKFTRRGGGFGIGNRDRGRRSTEFLKKKY